MRHHCFEVVIRSLESRRRAMEKFRSDGIISFASEAFGNVADVRIHAKGFLKNQKTGPGR